MTRYRVTVHDDRADHEGVWAFEMDAWSEETAREEAVWQAQRRFGNGRWVANEVEAIHDDPKARHTAAVLRQRDEGDEG